MSREALNLQYFLSDNGNRDEVIEGFSSNCFELFSYIITKHRLKDKSLLNNLFVEDITLCLKKDDNNILKHAWINKTNSNNIITINRYEQEGEEAIILLDKLLDNGEMVIVQTILELLPFTSYYQPNFKIEDFRPGHAFLIVWHDNENYYYVDHPMCLNQKKQTLYEHNKEIGVVRKSDIVKIYKCFLKCYTVTINEGIENSKERITYIFESIIKNYNKDNELKDNFTIIYGRNALIDMISVCDKGYLDLNNNIGCYSKGLFFIRNVFRNAINRRLLIYRYLQGIKEDTKKIDHICNMLDNDIESWRVTWNIIEKNYIKGENFINSYYLKYFNHILDVEDCLIGEFCKLC